MELELNLGLETFEERLAHIEQLVEDGKLNGIGNGQKEFIATYLLKKAPRDKVMKKKYLLMSKSEFDTYIERQRTGVEVDNPDEPLKIYVAENNDYINMDWKVTDDDLREESTMGLTLRNYNIYKNLLNELQKAGKISVKAYRRLMSDINDDMLLTKQICKSATEKDKHKKWIGDKIDYDAIDYTNEHHIEAIISNIYLKGDIIPNNTMCLIAYDILFALDEMQRKELLTDKDRTVVDMTNERYKLKEIGSRVGIQESGVRKRFKKICQKIAKYNARKINTKNKKDCLFGTNM